ncbi:group II intron reverse transcriptase [Chitinophaga sp. LS1]|nr:reverse transcriptase domain-containing protein [Chitinophaga sp. LS1]WPV65945.1 reverse transcriptase domain-containing protein [Chitinophaga sp. LS1]
MLIKMLLEPIWESLFMNCSNGFRPKRRTMDCIALLDSYINKRNKYYWIIEGDIRGAFDNIHHETLMSILSKRIGDQRILNLINQFLKAGVMENGLFHKSESGSPQGGICSPLLANIYLHEMDKYWWEHYGGLHRKAKEKRRTEKKGNCSLIKYADDWLLLTNGTKQEAYRLRNEFEKFLKEKLHLELSVEKTHITHVNKGFDFLGFNIRRHVRNNDKPKMFITPTKRSIEKLKMKVKEMTARKRFKDVPLLKFSALNALLRGWIAYYRHSNVKTIAKQLDLWVNRRLVSWLKKRHRLPVRRILKMYKKRQNGTRNNLGIQDGNRIKYLFKMFDQPLTKYKSRKPANLYLNKDAIIRTEAVTVREVSIPDKVWFGNADNESWRVIKAELKAARGARCEICGSLSNLDLHHIKAKKTGGKDTKENAQLLCESCHIKTPTYGRQKK